MSDDIQYPEHFVDRLEIVWGAGFLSPGGPEEVKEIVKGLDLSGSTILDVGCGIGGPAIVLAGDLAAQRVVGIDVEPQLLERARGHVVKADLGARVELRVVEAGPLAFPDASFDLVFSKDALVHVEDKAGFFREALRVLKPGGAIAVSDWLASADAYEQPAFLRYRELGHLDFTMATAVETEAILREAGFAEVASRDRNVWYAELAAYEVAQIAGPLRSHIVEAAGEEMTEHWIKVRRALAEAAAVGALRPTHLRGRRPDA